MLEDYQRYDQVGECRGVLEVAGRDVTVDSWFGCRDHSWGVREHVGIPEPVTGSVPGAVGGLFSFLFFSTDTHGGHVQVAQPAGGERYLSATVVDRVTGAIVAEGARADVEAEFVDDDRPRRMRRVVFTSTRPRGKGCGSSSRPRDRPSPCRDSGTAATTTASVSACGAGSSISKPRSGTCPTPLSSPTWTDRARRPVHRIQPVSVTTWRARGAAASHGTGSLTFIAEGPLEDLRDDD